MNTQIATLGQQALDESLANVIEKWLEYERMEGASANTLTAYRKGMDTWQAWLTGTTPGNVTPQTVREFKANLAERYSPQTVNLRLVAVRSFYRYLVNTDRMPSNPAGEVKGAKRPKSKTHKRDALANGEVLAVLDTCQTGTLEGVRDKAILSLMAYCALRQVEIHRANIGNLKTKGGRLVLEVQGKGRLEADEDAVIPVHQEPVIRAWLAHRMTFKDHRASDALFISLSRRARGQRLTTRRIREMVKARYAQAGVADLEKKSTHSLRHSAITNVIRHGGTLMQAQRMARHASSDTTLGYYHEVSRLDNPAEDLISYGERG